MLCRVMCLMFFVAWTAERAGDEMYYGNWRSWFGLLSPLFDSIPGLRMMPWQVLLLLLGPLCLLAPGAWRRRSWPLDAAVVASLATIALTFLWGLATGGSAYFSYFQLRSPVVMLYTALVLACVVRTPADLRALGRTVLAAALVRALLATYFYLIYVRNQPLDPMPQYMTSHDDSLLFTAAVIVSLAWALARRSWASWAWFALVFVWLAAGMRANNRRLAWVELLAMLGFAYLLMPRGGLKRRINWAAVAAAPLLIIYVAVGWGRGGAVFAPVRAISSINEEKDLSTMARAEENLNLVWTFQKSPLLGLGWGKGYREASSAFTRGFENFDLYPYLPHNSLLAIATFSGAVGLAGILLPLPVAAFLATRAYRRATSATGQAAAMAALCYLPAWTMQAFGDIGFQSLDRWVAARDRVHVCEPGGGLDGRLANAGCAARRGRRAAGESVGEGRVSAIGKQQSPERVWLGPVPADAVDLPGALERIAQLVEARAGGSVYTPNVDHLVNAQDDPAFRAAYAAADLALVDGTPVLWLCRLLGMRLRERVSGADLVRPLMHLAASLGYRVYLLGSAPGVAQRAAAILADEAPGLQVVATSSPHIDMSRPPEEREALRRELCRAQPDLVLVALGAPKAEKFSHECRQHMQPPAPVFVCVGAGLDFVAGVVRRSPVWMSRAGLEWLYRLLQEPRRLWRRYLVRGPRVLPLFAALLLARALSRGMRLGRAASRTL